MIKYIPIMKAKVKKYIIKIGDDQYVRVMPEGISIINNFKNRKQKTVQLQKARHPISDAQQYL